MYQKYGNLLFTRLYCIKNYLEIQDKDETCYSDNNKI